MSEKIKKTTYSNSVFLSLLESAYKPIDELAAVYSMKRISAIITYSKKLPKPEENANEKRTT